MNATGGWIPNCSLFAVFLAFAAPVAGATGDDHAKVPARNEARVGAVASSPAGDESEIVELKRLLSDQQKQISEQQRQIEELRSLVREQGRVLTRISATADAKTPPAAVQPSDERTTNAIASAAPMLPPASGPARLSVLPASQGTGEGQEASPLQLRVGSAYITPVGFMDFTAVVRDTAPGSGIGTNFGNFPYRTRGSATGNLSEFRFSPQNSRLGMRVDAEVKGAQVMGYWESDFLGGVGNPPVGNVAVSSNSYPFRLRLYWVNVRKGKFEFLGGQTWSLITPGRKGISPLPGDLFYTHDIDVNYQLGLVWGRIPEFRMVYHPSPKVAIALALDNPEQYIGGSGGAGRIDLPANLGTAYAGQLNNGSTTLGVPNLHPDIIAKIAFDPTLPNGNAFHFELGAVERTFRTFNPLTGRHYTAAGMGVQANLSFELVKGFRFLTNNYWSDGGGRYIFGQAPDLVVRNDGSISLVHSYSTVTGFELTHNNFLAYAYYGGVYIARNVILAPNNGGFVGYGFPGSSDGHNRSIQEATIGFNNTFWKDARFGALSFITQYSYFVRSPWYTSSGAPKNTHLNEVFLDLRYTLPGSAPALK